MYEPFIGMIAVFGFNFAPLSWAAAQGQTMSIAQYTTLFALLGIRFGGNGQTNFMLPDLKGRTMIGYSASHQIAQFGGAETITLTQAQMPSHTHTATFTPGGAGSAVTVEASPTAGNTAVPVAGDFISACSVSSGPGAIKNFVDPANKGTTVALGGVTGGGGSGGTVTIGNTGGTTTGTAAINTMMPYLSLNPCIALDGVFPSQS